VIPTALLLVPAALLFQTLGGRLDALLGVPMMGLPMLWAALAIGLLLPFLPLPTLRRAWTAPAAIALLGVLLIGWTSATSGFNADHPKPNMVIYDLDADTGIASWLTTAGAGLGFGRSGQLDAWISQFFADEIEATDVAGWSAGPEMTTPGYRATAPVADLSAPALEVLANEVSGDARTVRFRVTSPRGATNVRMFLEAQVTAVSIEGIDANVAELDVSDGLWIHYIALPPEGIEVALTIEPAGPLAIELHDWSQGLPAIAGFSIEPRPTNMFPSAHDLADTTMVRKTYDLR
jgi:hypothetical protein